MITAILGGGQLARMLALAGAPLGLRTRVLDPSPDAVAGHVAELVTASYDDRAALQRLADGAEVCTFEFENVPVAATEWLTSHANVRPHPRALAVGQDRLEEKTLFQRLGIGVADCRPASTRAELHAAVKAVGAPCIVKTRRLGYDGRGQVRLQPGAELTAAVDAAWEELPPRPPSKLRESGRLVKLVSRVEGRLSGLDATAAEAIRALPSLVSFEPKYEKRGEPVRRTVDLPSAAGFATLVHAEPEVVRQDYEAIRRLQQGLILVRS